VSNVIKGVHLECLRVVEDPEEMATKYYNDGADEIVYINTIWKKTILENIKEVDEVYFAHSFVVVPREKSTVLPYAKYGENIFAAVIKKSNIYGTQFHPEKAELLELKSCKTLQE